MAERATSSDEAAVGQPDLLVAAVLADLLNGVEVSVPTTSTAHRPGVGDRVPRRHLGGGGVPSELSDLPGATLRALARITRAVSTEPLRYPSVRRALQDVVVVEVIAGRLGRRPGATSDPDALIGTVADTLDYFAELAGMRLEGAAVTHGVVIAGDTGGVEPVGSAVAYPGRLPTRKRTPLLFDGTHSALVVDTSGHVVRAVERVSLPASGADDADLSVFDELPGLDGALTAAASAAFHGIGVYLRADHSTWIFDDGALLFVRRGIRWKSIAFESFTQTLISLSNAGAVVGRRIARAALRLSMQGHGAILAVAGDRRALDTVIQPKDRAPGVDELPGGTVDDDLRQLLRLHDISSASGLARLARLDGATILDEVGNVVAYGAIVRSADSQDEGARAAAARALSTVVDVALTVSHDGPVTVYHRGDVVLQVL